MSPVDIVVTQERVYLAAPCNESVRHLQEDGWSAKAEPLAYPWWEDRFTCLTKMLTPGRAVSDCAGTCFTDRGHALAGLRHQLHDEEIDRYRILGEENARVHEEVLGELTSGISERETADRLGCALLLRGLRPVVMLVGTDERLERYPHPIPTPETFRERMMVCTCVEKWGLVVSSSYFLVTETGCRQWAEKHGQITDCLVRMIEQTRPGLRVADCVRLIRESLTGAGVAPDWTVHHQGGATGYRPRDYVARTESVETIAPSQAFVWNPYGGGVKQEATFITGAGPEEGPLVLASPGSWPAVRRKVGKQEYSFLDLLVTS